MTDKVDDITLTAAATAPAAPSGFAAVVPPIAEPVVAPVDEKPTKLPTSVTMTDLFGYWTDETPPRLRIWQQGQVVDVMTDIADLKMRGAPCQDSGTL